MAERTEEKDLALDRWWVETIPSKGAKPARSPGPVGSRLFAAARGFDQDSARERLTDNNLRLLQGANPQAGKLAYVQLAEAKHPARELERIRQLISLPPYACGVIADSGRSIRVVVTGSPVGQRILELVLIETPSFDCWINGEWVCEALFDNVTKALDAFPGLVARYLSPEAGTEPSTTALAN